jgi:uncharacterized membrane protein required for colicin V production
MVIDIIIVLAFIFFAGLGYLRGFVKTALAMFKVSVSAIVAFILANPTSRMVCAIFKLKRDGTVVAITAIVLFVLIRLAMRLIAGLTDKAREKNKTINWLDRVLGLALGIVRFMFIFSILAVIFYIVTRIPFARSLEDVVFRGSKIAHWLYELVVYTLLIKLIAAASSALGGGG